jgi:hypothetical protein
MSKEHFKINIYWILLFCLAVALALGFTFRAFVLDYLVQPLALVLWAARRLWLAIDQEVYWIIAILVVLVLTLRALRLQRAAVQRNSYIEAQSQSDRQAYWRILLQRSASGGRSPSREVLLAELRTLLARAGGPQVDRSAYLDAASLGLIYDAVASSAPDSTAADNHGPLPPGVAAFLYPDWQRNAQPARTFIARLTAALRRLAGWRLGRSSANFYTAVSATLDTIETYLEIEHDQHSLPTEQR